MTDLTKAENTSSISVSAALIDNADNAGKFFPYISGVDIPVIPGTRSVVATYKQTPGMRAKGIEAKQNVYVRVPTAHITLETVTENISILAPFIVQYLQGIEDENIKKYHREGGTQVFTDTLSLEKVIDTLEESGNTGLNSEIITEWFTSEVAKEITEILMEKLNIPNGTAMTEVQQEKIGNIVQSYLDVFISLASGKVHLAAQQREKLSKCIELTKTGKTVIGTKILSRLDRMDKKEKEALESLGDLDL